MSQLLPAHPTPPGVEGEPPPSAHPSGHTEFAPDSDGHFIDDFVDSITNLDEAHLWVHRVSNVIEWLFLLALFVVPLWIAYSSFRKSRWAWAGGSSVFFVVMVLYQLTLPTRRFGLPESWMDWVPRLSMTWFDNMRENTVLDSWRIPVGDWVEQTTTWVDQNLKDTLEVIEWPFTELLRLIVDQWLLSMSWVTVCFAVLVVGWMLRGPSVGVTSALALVICGLLGEDYWLETARTIGLIGVAVLLCAIIGIPIGILCGRVDGAWTVVRPILDAMQVVHSFVYMLPFIFFFGIGPASATMVTMVFALPPLIRLTNLGIRQVPDEVVEAARAYGAPERRVLTDVQLPLARPALLTGLNQTLLLAISMLGIAAIMGAGGLGRLLFQAISNLDVGLAGSGGLAFFLVAVVLDRISQPTGGDDKNLLTRMIQAWSHRRTPEELLAEQDDEELPAVTEGAQNV